MKVDFYRTQRPPEPAEETLNWSVQIPVDHQLTFNELAEAMHELRLANVPGDARVQLAGSQMSTGTLTYTGELVITTCWCGITMALPGDLYEHAGRTGAACYCPLGHSWIRGNNMAKRLKEAEDEAQRLRGLWRDEYDQHKRTERRLKATRGVVTRTKRRIAKEVLVTARAKTLVAVRLGAKSVGAWTGYPAAASTR